jgi:NAD(P)H-dependent FMN reductase
MQQLTVLAFAASFRQASLNRKLIRLAAVIAEREGALVDHADFREFDVPMYDGDVEAASGLPPGALELKRRVEAVDALILSIPEYNYSIPGSLKNVFDWVSRARPMPWRGRSAAAGDDHCSPRGAVADSAVRSTEREWRRALAEARTRPRLKAGATYSSRISPRAEISLARLLRRGRGRRRTGSPVAGSRSMEGAALLPAGRDSSSGSADSS